MPEYFFDRGPRPASYEQPNVNFDWLGNLPQAYQEGQQYGLKRQQQTAFQGGLPRNPDGSIDTNAITDTLFRLGGAQAAAPVAQRLIGADLYRQMIGESGGSQSGPLSQSQQPVQPTAGGSSSDPRGKIPVILAAARKYGVDPRTAVLVARSEGLANFSGDNGLSGGAFQLYTKGGLGNEFQKETGLNPLDPKNEDATIDWAMRNVARTGWSPYKGAAKVGIGPRQGIGQQTAQAGAGGPGTGGPAPNQTAGEEPSGAMGTPPFAPTSTAAASKSSSGPANIGGQQTRVASLSPDTLINQPTEASSTAEAATMQASPGSSQDIGPGGAAPGAPQYHPRQPVARDVVPQGPAPTTGQETQVAQAPGQSSNLPSQEFTSEGAAQKNRQAAILRRSAGALAAAGFPAESAKAQLDQAATLDAEATKIREFLAKRSQEQFGVGIEAQKKGATGLAEAKTKQVGEFIEAGGKPARDTLNSLNTIEDAIKSGGKNIVFGPGAENWQKVKQTLNNIYPQAGVAEADTIQKMNARLAAQAAKQMTARPTQLEFRTFMANNPGLMNSREGTLALINILRQTTEQDIALGKLASRIKDPNDWSDIEEKFYKGKEGKLISPFTGKPMGEVTKTSERPPAAATKFRWTPDGGVKPY